MSWTQPIKVLFSHQETIPDVPHACLSSRTHITTVCSLWEGLWMGSSFTHCQTTLLQFSSVHIAKCKCSILSLNKQLCAVSAVAYDCKAVPGQFYDRLLKKCFKCSDLCGHHPLECSPVCPSKLVGEGLHPKCTRTPCVINISQGSQGAWREARPNRRTQAAV
uniref:TACI cysteine-rich domain-containing protein n=1 Tax=Electrophorus electricus TaxID=8005 RepID=A0AAY5EHV1_ELEEL